MKLTIHGAAQTVTGSQYLITLNSHMLLLECGLYQGRRADTYTRNQTFQYDPADLDAVILSHAHIDHSGNLPNLVKRGFNKRIYTTEATAELADVMLQDSGHVQESDVEFVNKKAARRGEPPVKPLYTIEDARRVKEHFEPVRYNQVFEPIPGIQAHLEDAGHILGSASIVLDVREDGRRFRFWFSGDIGRLKLPLLPDPVLPHEADYLMMECTYGDKPHRDPDDAYREFRDIVGDTVARGGKVIIPAFAVGRTQELVYDLNRMFTGGEIPRVPVYVDSPLAVNATAIFKNCPDYYDEETRQFVAAGKHPALNFPGLHYITSVEESKKLNDRHEPMIIISASGMAEAGRILHHLRNNIEEPRNSIVIVSWQAPFTLGRRLADREKHVRIFGEEFDVRARVHTVGGLSAHAGQDFLLQYAAASAATLRQIILVHSEPSIAATFSGMLRQQTSVPIAYPALHEVLDI